MSTLSTIKNLVLQTAEGPQEAQFVGSIVKSSTGETFETHSTDTTKHLTAAEKASLSHVKSLYIVETITERDAIAEPFIGLSAYAKDATGDSTVKTGGAYYIYDGTAWIKTAEAESLDVAFHEHANKADVLDKLSVADDTLAYDGKPIGSMRVVASIEEAQSATAPVGTLFLVV